MLKTLERRLEGIRRIEVRTNKPWSPSLYVNNLYIGELQPGSARAAAAAKASALTIRGHVQGRTYVIDSLIPA